ncbi:hypothetical protein BU16DRAFT_58890 [Lophium mytilinum]|uniref:Uncharacterized protein n=1 Tax=Lophium mytilinum TaxID=390894 RepID=A0A6A6QSM0_9PEZI|nr:hypothetical protein BU16DRAFT_58890 [Lophium mytilinum]
MPLLQICAVFVEPVTSHILGTFRSDYVPQLNPSSLGYKTPPPLHRLRSSKGRRGWRHQIIDGTDSDIGPPLSETKMKTAK